MSSSQTTAVEITRGDDHLDIWVDANNNGVRDDDDVNIFVTKNGSLYTESPNFKGQIDQILKERVRELGVALLNAPQDREIETRLCTLALEMVEKAVHAQAQQQDLPPLPAVTKWQ